MVIDLNWISNPRGLCWLRAHSRRAWASVCVMSRSNVLGAWCPLVICIVLSTVAAAPPEAWVSNGESGHDVDGCGLDQFSPCSSVSFAWFQFFNAGIQLHLDVGQYSLASVPIVNASNVTIIGSGRYVTAGTIGAAAAVNVGWRVHGATSPCGV